MGLIEPTLPDLDLAEWRTKPLLARIRPMVLHWTENGAGTPAVVQLLYVVKVGLYILGAIAVASTTPGLGSLEHFRSWWSQPIVFQKVVIYSMVLEVVGVLGASGPLMYRFKPPIGGILYWVRRGTIRLPPWPTRVPFTRGTYRSAIDVVLYLGILASGVWLLFSPAVGDGGLSNARLVPLAVLVPLLGLRDKTIFLAARSENYWMYLLLFFFPVSQWLMGAKLVMIVLWLGVAASKLTYHFSYVIPVMTSNSPLMRSKWFKRKFYRRLPDDVRPSTFGAVVGYSGVLFESVPPLILLFSRGGTLTTVCLVIMVVWHLHILSTIPVGVPLEWNVFFIFSTLFLFGHYSEIGFGALHSPVMIVLLIAFAALPVVGAVRPDLVSFLLGMRYYAGNWAQSLWCYRKSASEDKIDRDIVKAAPCLKTQLGALYPPDLTEWFLFSGVVVMGMHLPGRALLGLLPRALDDVENYDVRFGELEAGHLIGWNFGDGHLSHHQLLAAVQERCNFAEGELRVVFLESQPIHRLRHHYRIMDAATGVIEEGYVHTRDLVARQPWLDAADPTIPVEPLVARWLT